MNTSLPHKVRAAHLQQVLLRGSDARLPIDPDKALSFSMKGHRCNLSCFQLSVYLSLCVGLSLPLVHPPAVFTHVISLFPWTVRML